MSNILALEVLENGVREVHGFIYVELEPDLPEQAYDQTVRYFRRKLKKAGLQSVMLQVACR